MSKFDYEIAIIKVIKKLGSFGKNMMEQYTGETHIEKNARSQGFYCKRKYYHNNLFRLLLFTQKALNYCRY